MSRYLGQIPTGNSEVKLVVKTLQDVADALGDTLTVVQRHYAGRSEERTARTNEAIRSTWANDPTLKRARTQKHGAHELVSFGARRKKEFQRANGYAVGIEKNSEF